MIRLLKKIVGVVGTENILEALSQETQSKSEADAPTILKRLERAENLGERAKIIANASGEDKKVLRREVPELVEKAEEILESTNKIERIIQRAEEREKATF